MNYFLLPVLVLLVLINTSCTSQRYIDIQVLNPAEVKLPGNIEKVFILAKNRNAIVAKTKSNEVFSSFMQSFYNTLKINLPQSPIFSESKFYICKPDSFYNISNQKVSSDHQISSFITIDSLFMSDTVYRDLSINTNLYKQVVKFEFRFSIVGRFSVLQKQGPIFPFVQKDTVIWEFANDIDAFNLLSKNGLAAYERAGIYVGEMTARKISPYWTTQERVLIKSSGKLMRKAYKSFLDNEIQNAINRWKMVYDVGTNSLASYAAQNIAVCYEMLDDLDLSEEWLVKSTEKLQNNFNTKYLKTIKARKDLALKLDSQIIL